MSEKTQISRRLALKTLGAGAALYAVPRNWKKPFVTAGSAPAFGQVTELGTGDLQITVTWDTDFSDVDTHCIEPDGTRVWFANDVGPTATLDFDDTEGFGPENIFVAPGNAAAGTYRAQVVFWDDDGAGDTVATIRVRVFADTPSQDTQTFTRNLTAPADNTVGFNVADITFPAGTITEVTGTDVVPNLPAGESKPAR